MMMPSVQGVNIESFKDLIGGGFEIPEWIHPLIKALYFMQYFSGEMTLSKDILKEIHDETKFTLSTLDQILVIQGFPTDAKDEKGEPLYTKELIKSEIVKIIQKHGVRVLKPLEDIVFSENGDSVVVILDGIDHMKLMPAGDSAGDSPIAEAESEESSDEEGKEKAEEKKQPKKPVKKEEETPVIYNCPACTYENPIGNTNCELCASERPSMEIILADFRRANQPPEEPKPKVEGGASAAKTPTQEKLDDMAKDMRRIISRLERKSYKAKLDKIE